MNEHDLQKRYDELFPDDSAKARAFDAIAKQYYFCNFGATQKADIDVLMFSLYLDQILDLSEEDIQTYSDYTLAKYLGIPQGRVSTLKVKKELKYPYARFDWKKSFFRICNNARYEKGKIKIYIPDKNLYLEIKNAIETTGGYVEVQLNTHLLQVAPEYFIDLVLALSDDTDRAKIRKSLKEQLTKKNIDTEFFERQSVGDILKQSATEVGISAVSDIISTCIPVVGPAIGTILKNAIKETKNDDE